MIVGLVAASICAIVAPAAPRLVLPDAVSLAGAAGRLNVITTTFDWNDRYNLWSGLIGGTFLALAYFGTDQIAGAALPHAADRSRESRRGLFFNAVAKIPMQLFILFIGAMVFVFYVYEKPPMLFQQTELARIQSPAVRDRYAPIDAALRPGVRAAAAGGRRAAGRARGRRCRRS